MFALIRTRFLVSVAYLVAICLATLAESAYGQFDEPPAPPAAIFGSPAEDAPPALEDAPPAPVPMESVVGTVSESNLGVVANKPAKQTTSAKPAKRTKQGLAAGSASKQSVRKLHPTYMVRLVRSRQAEMPVTAPTIRANVVSAVAEVAVESNQADSQQAAVDSGVAGVQVDEATEAVKTTKTPELAVQDGEQHNVDYDHRGASEVLRRGGRGVVTQVADNKSLEEKSLNEIRALSQIDGLPIVRSKAELKSVATLAGQSGRNASGHNESGHNEASAGEALQSVLVNKPVGSRTPIVPVSYGQPMSSVASDFTTDATMLETPITVPAPTEQPAEAHIPSPQHVPSVEYATLDSTQTQPSSFPIVSQPVEGSTGCSTLASAGVIAHQTTCDDGSCGGCADAPQCNAASCGGVLCSSGGLLSGLCASPSCSSGLCTGGCLASLTARTTNAMPLGSSVNAYLNAQVAEGNKARSIVYLYDFFDPATAEGSQLNVAGRRKLAKLTASGWDGLPILVQPVPDHPELSEARRAAVEEFLVSQLGYSGSRVVLQDPDYLGLRGVEAEVMDRNRLQNTRSFGQLGGGGGQVGGATGGQGQQGQGQQGQGQQGQGRGQR